MLGSGSYATEPEEQRQCQRVEQREPRVLCHFLTPDRQEYFSSPPLSCFKAPDGEAGGTYSHQPLGGMSGMSRVDSSGYSSGGYSTAYDSDKSDNLEPPSSLARSR